MFWLTQTVPSKKIIVSDWLKNPAGANSINDISELDGIENVKGDEAYTMNPNNMRVWDAKGNDIYYQGTTQKALPVDVSISYQLDGKPISAEDLAGKSGRVTIRFSYQNNQKGNHRDRWQKRDGLCSLCHADWRCSGQRRFLKCPNF